MKKNSSVMLTSILLGSVAVIALITGLASYSIGHEALKGINQIDVKPIKAKKASSGVQVTQGQPVPFLKESELIAGVKSRIKGELKGGKAKPVKK
jgi:hypothetical protein